MYVELIMTDEIDISRARVEELLKDTTPGPWKVVQSGWSGNEYDVIEGPGRVAVVQAQDEQGGASWSLDADACFIAEARTLVPALLAEIEQLESLLRSVPGYTTGGSFRAAIAELVDSESYWKARARQAEAKINRIRALADNAPEVPVHAGGGNLVNRQKMVAAADLRAILDGER